MYINGMPLLTTILKNTKYCKAIWVADHMAHTIANLVESVRIMYNSSDFQVRALVHGQDEDASHAADARQWGHNEHHQ